MYSELIVIVMIGNEESAETWRDLEKSYGGQLFKLIDVMLVHRNTSGSVLSRTPRQAPVGLVKDDGHLAGAFARAIFCGSEEESRSRLVEAGLDPRFSTDVDQALKPDNSAYLIYVPGGSLIDTRRYLVMLGQLQGDLYHTIFRSRVEEALLNTDN